MPSDPGRPSIFGCPPDLLNRLPLGTLLQKPPSKEWKQIKQRLSLTRGRVRNQGSSTVPRTWSNRIEWHRRVALPLRRSAPSWWRAECYELLDAYLGTGRYEQEALLDTPEIFRRLDVAPELSMTSAQRMHCQWRVLDAMLRQCYARMVLNSSRRPHAGGT